MSKKQQVEKFLTKEVKSEETSLLFYNFNDYGQKTGANGGGQAGAQPQAPLEAGNPSDRVPSRQLTRGGSRRGNRGSSIGARGVTRGTDGGEEHSPQPGMMSSPNEFGPHPAVRQPQKPVQQVLGQIQGAAGGGGAFAAGGGQHGRIHRLGSPFHDYHRKGKGAISGAPQRHKHGKVVLPSLPQKGQGEAAQEGGAKNRSPMRTTSFGVIMEMIKEEEPQ